MNGEAPGSGAPALRHGTSAGRDWTPRGRCYRCHKPQLTCVCDSIPLVDNRTCIYVLQHPRETFHPIGTARFAELGLARVRVERANPASGRTVVPAFLPARTALLYPAPGARPLESIGAHERPECLIALDGTWHHARTLYRDTPWLHSLPAFSLTPKQPSRYRIRREPHAACVSTIEAIVAALEVLEPETPRLDGLIRAFDRMIDVQASYVEGATGRSRERRRRAESYRKLPRSLVEHFDRLVVTYGESALLGTASAAPRVVVQWTAVRPSTGALFERFVRPGSEWVRPWHLRHMRLDAGDLNNGGSLGELARAWQEFSNPDDIITAWNASSLDLLRTFDPDPRTVVLKGAYCNQGWGPSGTLDEVVSVRGLHPESLPCRGRAATRLANAVAVARFLHARVA